MSDPAPPVAAQKSEDADTPEVVWIPSLLFLRTPWGSINLIGPLPELFGHASISRSSGPFRAWDLDADAESFRRALATVTGDQ
jgi:hypothetical protein